MQHYINAFYQSNINQIGGVETVIYNIAKLYGYKNITIIYREGSSEQLRRISKYAKVVKFDNREFECERLFVNYGWDEIKDYVKVPKEERYYVVHANYEYLNEMDGGQYTIVPDDFKVLAVSKFAGDKCGKPYRVCYNPVLIENVKRPLLIVSATRLASDKGKIKWRMQTLADKLSKRKIPFLWLVFTDSRDKIENINVVNITPRLDIKPYLLRADFVAQLSDSEACCMTALESEMLGTPMLVTKIPSFYEQGLNEDNAVFFDFDMSNVDECIDKMLNKKFDFKFTPQKDIWDELLIDGKKEEIIPMKTMLVKATDKWQEGGGIVCKDINRIPQINEEFETDEVRCQMLIDKGFVTFVKEIKEEKPITIEKEMAPKKPKKASK